MTTPMMDTYTMKMMCPLTKKDLNMPKDCPKDCAHLAERALFPQTPDKKGVGDKHGVYALSMTCVYPAKK